MSKSCGIARVGTDVSAEQEARVGKPYGPLKEGYAFVQTGWRCTAKPGCFHFGAVAGDPACLADVAVYEIQPLTKKDGDDEQR